MTKSPSEDHQDQYHIRGRSQKKLLPKSFVDNSFKILLKYGSGLKDVLFLRFWHQKYLWNIFTLNYLKRILLLELFFFF